MQETKKCLYCEIIFTKKEYPHIFNRKTTCGSKKCGSKQRMDYTKKHLKEYQREYSKQYRISHKKSSTWFKSKKCMVCERVVRMQFNQLYCSKKCIEFWNANHDTLRNIQNKRTKLCAYCKNKFIAPAIDGLCCSKKCSAKFHYLRNKDKIIFRNNRIRRKRKNGIIEKFTLKELQEKKIQYYGICPRCNILVGENNLTLDHIKPISSVPIGFVYTINDIQFLCRPCNSAKGIKVGLC